MFRTAVIDTGDARSAVERLHHQLAAPDLRAVIAFITPNYGLLELGPALTNAFSAPVIGCSAASVFGEGVVHSAGLAAAGFYGETLSAQVHVIEPLQDCVRQATSAARTIKDQLEQTRGKRALAIMLVDGLSSKEEPLAATLHAIVPDLPLVGASASDQLDFRATPVLANGQFASNRAVLLLLTGNFRFALIHSHQFRSTGQRMVVTASSPDRRLVMEFDGEPAARRYGELTGLALDELTTANMTNHPLMAHYNGSDLVRAVHSRAGEDGLHLCCAVHNGEVLRLGESLDPVVRTVATFEAVRTQLDADSWSGCLGFDGILRQLDFEHKNILPNIADIYARYHMVGFSTYGEQMNAHHQNNTLAGVAFLND